jgi:N-methylhydantoinase A/oxoprolinase/acetone carboxylase beta subunit
MQDEEICGPAIIYGETASIAIGPGWSGRIDSNENLILGKVQT